MFRRLSPFFFLLLLVSALAGQEPKSVQGKVTQLDFLKFNLINFKVQIDQGTMFAVANGSTRVVSPLWPELLKDDAEVEVKGVLDSKTNSLQPQSITFLLGREYISELAATAMVQRPASLNKSGTGWTGTVHADGRDLIVNEKTELRFLPDSRPQEFEHIGSNVFVAYVGKRMLDGTIRLERAAFWNNEVDKDELKLRKRDEPVMAPSEPKNNFATLTINDGRPMKLVGSEALQKQVSAIGMRLVPEYQRALPKDDPTKIDFRFYVIHDKKRMVRDALNGTILVPDSTLVALHNEAQFAAVLSIAIAQVIEKQEYQSRHRRNLQSASGWLLMGAGAIPSPLSMLALPAQIANSATYKRYMIAMMEQAGRVGLDYMIAAGYDPRQAPEALKLSVQKHPEKNDDLPEFGTYLQTELETTYWKQEFTGARVGEKEYAELVKELQ